MALLTSGNAKILKAIKRGFLTVGIHLAPADESGRNFCSFASSECKAACLFRTGRAEFDPSINEARIRKSHLFTNDRVTFMSEFIYEVATARVKAESQDLELSVRPNLTSDIRFENVRITAAMIDAVKAMAARSRSKAVRKWAEGLDASYPNIYALFADVQFYDYTKYPLGLLRRARQTPNYHLTFSYSGHNGDEAARMLEHGINVAAVFNVKKGQPLPAVAVFGGKSYPVIDGDDHDLRFLDEVGVVVGLRLKGRKTNRTSAFVIQTAN